MIIVECKNYSWTKNGFSPAAKLATANEAILYLLYLSKDKKRIIVLAKKKHPEKKETVAEYYFRINHHLFNGVELLELNERTNELRDF